MQFVIKCRVTVLAALALCGSMAFAAGEAEPSIIDALKSSATTQPTVTPQPAAAPAAAVQAPTKNPAANIRAVAAPPQVAANAHQMAGFPDTKPSTSEAGYPVKTVKELIELEAKLALAKSKDRFDAFRDAKGEKLGGSGALGLRPSNPLPPSESIDLLAVFGHGKQRFVSMHYNGHNYYRLANGERVGPYTLASVSGSCVVLARESQVKTESKKGKKSTSMITERNLCINDAVPMFTNASVFGPSPSPAMRLNDALPALRPAGAVFQ